MGGTLKPAVKDSDKALKDVTFSIEQGEIFGLLGPNGGGKTTLFRVLSTYFSPDSGSVKISGEDIFQNPLKARFSLGLVFQSPSLDKKLTVRENLIHQGHLYGISGKFLENKILDLLSQTGLTERKHQRAETLSGGLQRRIEIAKGMIHSPKILLMDEPTTGLDPGARIDLWKNLLELKETGATIVLTTHLMDDAEKCDRLAILNKGEMVALGTPHQLKEEIGGDVIVVETKYPEELSKKFQEKYALPVIMLENAIRIEKERGHEFVPELVKAFGDKILSITVSKPTLEDVFIHKTGHKFWSQDKNP